MRKIIRMGKIESLMMNGCHEKIEEEGGKGIRERWMQRGWRRLGLISIHAWIHGKE